MEWDDALLAILLSIILVWGIRIMSVASNPRAHWPEVVDLLRDLRPRRKR